MNQRDSEEIRRSVRDRYGAAAGGCSCGCSSESTPSCHDTTASCCSSTSSCCTTRISPAIISERLGYSPDDLAAVPEGAVMGLGCGNPQAIAALKPGEVVLDLGSGGGLDCFLAAQQVGATGRVIGVDMTPQMISKARANIAMAGTTNVEFRLGEIEHLPVPDASVDVIISNCVINLSPDKRAVFKEAYRVLRPGGRLAISDVVATAVIPDELRNDPQLWSGCVSGAEHIDVLEMILRDVGFEAVRICPTEESRELIREWVPNKPIADYVVSATIEATKPS